VLVISLGLNVGLPSGTFFLPSPVVFTFKRSRDVPGTAKRSSCLLSMLFGRPRAPNAAVFKDLARFAGCIFPAGPSLSNPNSRMRFLVPLVYGVVMIMIGFLRRLVSLFSSFEIEVLSVLLLICYTVVPAPVPSHTNYQWSGFTGCLSFPPPFRKAFLVPFGRVEGFSLSLPITSAARLFCQRRANPGRFSAAASVRL